jgi:hypothetical protein
VKITRINDIMKTQILDMFQNECHICGTAQTNHDFFFDDKFTVRFSRKILPAMVDRKNRIALWPEWMDFEELETKEKERGTKVFNQEYLCSPVYSENAYLDKEKLMSVVSETNRNYTFDEWRKEIERRQKKAKEDKREYQSNDLVAGWDLGKKGHPAHFTIFEKIYRGKKDKEGHKLYERIQVHSKWFDHRDYTDQLEYIEEALDVFEFYQCFYDSTRGELEMLEEQGKLPGEFKGIHFTFKAKHAMAAEFDRAIGSKLIEVLNDSRQIGQILIVNNDLQAPETPEGHGDSFWSIGMTFNDQEAEGVDITFI